VGVETAAAHVRSVAGAYPAELARSWGLWLNIRPILPDDAELEAQFVADLSPESRYNRFFSSNWKLTPEWLQRYTNIDYDRHMALVATVMLEGRERFVGVARYVCNESQDSAEFAIVVADAWQGGVIGDLLLARLIECAHAARVGQLVGEILATNNAMLRLAARRGFKLRHASHGMRVAVLDLRDSNAAAREGKR
jgi:acetyltransferase